MKITWLHKQENSDCVLFFNGWGMDAQAVQHLTHDEIDVCMCYDYSTIDSLDVDFSNYENVTVVAWSLGIWACSQVLKNMPLKVSKAIAINGTLLPLDVNYGIPPSVFKNTQLNWNVQNRDRFNRRVLGGKAAFEKYEHRMAQRSIEDQQEELGSILNQVSENKSYDFCFDKVLIGRSDLIFPPDNQWEFWKRKALIVEAQISHYPFNYFKNWQQIISL